MSDVPEMLTVEGAAARGGVSGGTIRRLIKQGALPVVRFSRRNVRVPADALDAFIATHRGPARRPAPVAHSRPTDDLVG